jgi:hypothetical protein
MGRSRSTPGLVESRGKVPVSEMQITRKDPTSASTATLLTDDELERDKSGEKNVKTGREAADSESNASECSSSRQDMQMHTSFNTNNVNNGTNYSHQSGSGLLGSSPIPPSSHSQMIYSPQLLSPTVQLINYDRRSPQPQTTLYAGTIPYYPHSPVSGSTLPYCSISPAVSSTHLSVPQQMALHTPSPTLSNDSHQIQLSQPMSMDPSQDAALLAEIKRLRERLLTLETENASMTIKLSQQQWEVENRFQFIYS